MIRKIHKILVIMIAMVFLLTGCGGESSVQPQDTATSSVPVASEKDIGEDSLLKVHFVDVGQGDCILIQSSEGENVLIDAGERDQAEKVLAYINSLRIEKLDVVVGTHPHSDHIGGLVKVIETIPAEKVYLPRVTHTSKTFEDLLQTIKSKGLKVSTAKAGVEIPLQNVKAGFVAPVEDSYDDLNNYSAVVKLNYGQNSFLFAGDAEKLSEKEMLGTGADLSADVLKIGHHGSSSSTGNKFLQAVSPSCAVIMCGADNDYGHPHEKTLAKLAQAGMSIYRTDQDGTIIITADGNNLNVTIGNKTDEIADVSNVSADNNDNINNDNDNDNDNSDVTADNDTGYIGNKNSKKFHRPDCRSLPAEHNRVYFDCREDAVKEGYTPCGNCKP